MTESIRVPHTEFAAIEVEKSRDGNRISISVLLKTRGTWTHAGVSPSFPASMLDSVINALMQLRDRAGGGK